MMNLLKNVDRLLRGQFTRREDLEAGRIGLPTDKLLWAALVLGAIYGLFMGIFAIMREENPSTLQLFATMIKVPLLFLATLLVTFPSLYVFSALAKSRLGGPDTLRLLVAAIAVNLALLASFGPITGFFTLSTDSYPFLVLLNVVFFAIAGFAGLVFLRRALGHLFVPEVEVPPRPAPAPAETGETGETTEPPPPPPPLPPASAAMRQRAATDTGLRIFRAWMAIYAFVGVQMGWILRPFIGVPEQPFTFFRPRDSNFFEGVLNALRLLVQ